MTAYKIAIIDDEPAAMASFLRRFPAVFPDCDLHFFTSAQAARKSISPDDAFDVIVIDASSGQNVTGGCDALKEMASHLKTPPQYVLFTSGDTDRAEKCQTAALQENISPNSKIYACGKMDIADKKSFLSEILSIARLDNANINVALNGAAAFFHDTIAPVSPQKLFEIIARTETDIHSKQFASTLADPKEFSSQMIGAFENGAGSPCHGHVIHSWGELGQKPITAPVLIIDKFDPAYTSRLSELKGLVVKDPAASGHLAFLAFSHGVEATIIGASSNEVWNKLLKIPSGTGVTLNTAKNSTGICLGHLRIDRNQPTIYSKDIERLYHLAQTEIALPEQKLKANVNAIREIDNAVRLAENGIGLVRTEHLARADDLSRQSIVDMLNGSEAAYDDIGHRHKLIIGEMFDKIIAHPMHQRNKHPYPVRIRLFDIAPEEFGVATTSSKRGVQIGLENAKLYENQLDAIFGAYAEKGEKSIGLEILVPMIETLDQLQTVKTMAAVSAKSHGLTSSDYTFGIMVENMPAATNIAQLVADNTCDIPTAFVNIGTNDLTADVLNISRSDPSKNNEFSILAPEIIDIIKEISPKIKLANPAAEICLCGHHAEDLTSSDRLACAKIRTSLSLPPSTRNFIGLAADLSLLSFKRHTNIQPYKPPAEKIVALMSMSP